jgi:long-chain acyl-CoA synthetase
MTAFERGHDAVGGPLDGLPSAPPKSISPLHGNRAAQIMGSTGQTLTHAELDERSLRLARHMRHLGLTSGDHIAVVAENHSDFLTVAWAAQRSGLYYTPIAFRSTPDELQFVADDCDARILFATQATLGAITSIRDRLPKVEQVIVLGSVAENFATLGSVLGDEPIEELTHAIEGCEMPYSSGTTGRPKGIRPLRKQVPWGTPPPLVGLAEKLYGLSADAVYLCPGPLYHAGPLRFAMVVQRVGATAVVMEHFDAREALELVDRYCVTHAQFVPTMLARMLALPDEVREVVDVTSLRHVLVSGGPFPVPMKPRLIDWWGPVIDEAYTGTEANGFVAISASEWLEHKGSVGKPVGGAVHVMDDDGLELPPGQTGTIYFEGAGQFEYYKAPAKTAAAHNSRGWSTLGDVGHLDDDGYLYLTDRKDYVINSGGVNIYPQEAERVLLEHPAVFEAAVFGIPNADFGEEVKAVVELNDGACSELLADELIDFCRTRLTSYKCPRSIEFVAELPRSPAGKLLKRVLRDPYWAASGSDRSAK